MKQSPNDREYILGILLFILLIIVLMGAIRHAWVWAFN